MALAREFPSASARRVLAFSRDLRVRRFAFQALFAAVVLVFGYVLISNIDRAVSARNLTFFPFIQSQDSFPWITIKQDFLGQRAGFSVDERAFGFDYSANDSYFRALLAGLLNTIQVSFVGIILATVLGLVMGVARLSTNWLVAKLAMVYIEVFRNVPLLVQLVFWYLAVFLKAPRIADSFDFFGIAYLSNRALALPRIGGGDNFGIWALFLLGALITAAAVKYIRTRQEEDTGKPGYPWWSAAGAFLAIALVTFFVTGMPLSVQTPEVGRTSYEGGITVSPEYAALLTGLVVYTGTFIAEIVRGSIQAIPRGQTEASAALGLNAFQRLRFVILPQALAIIVPPLTNQYLNLMKNSSLAVAVAFKDFFDVGRISINQSGQTVPIIVVLMMVYLTMSLSISAVMNVLYGRLKWRRAR